MDTRGPKGDRCWHMSFAKLYPQHPSLDTMMGFECHTLPGIVGPTVNPIHGHVEAICHVASHVRAPTTLLC